MKKMLAMLLAVLMLISACAVAESAGGQLIVRDVVIDMGGGQQLDLSGLDLILAVAANDEQAGLRLALEGAGQSALNAVAVIGMEMLTFHVDGLSDVYSISYADLMAMAEEFGGESEVPSAFEAGFAAGAAGDEMPAELEKLVADASEIFAGSITYAGTETIDGVEYEAVQISVGEEGMAVLLDDLVVFLDAYGQDGLEGSGYDSFKAMFDDAQLTMQVDGKLYTNDTDVIADIDVKAFAEGDPEPETLNIYAEITADAETAEFDVALSEADGEETEEIVSFIGSYSVVDGEFGEFELGIYEPYSDEALLYVSANAPAAQSEGKWEFYLGVNDGYETVSFYLDFGSVNGQDEFYAHLIADGETLYISYEGADGVGSLRAGMKDGEEILGGFYATVEVAEDDGAWLPGEVGETVDLLTIDDAQIEKVSNEAMILLMNAMSVLAAANETVASLLGSMM